MWAKRRTSTSAPVGCLGCEQTFYDDHVGHLWDAKLDKVETLAIDHLLVADNQRC